MSVHKSVSCLARLLGGFDAVGKSASASQLTKVPGVGPKLAKIIYDSLHSYIPLLSLAKRMVLLFLFIAESSYAQSAVRKHYIAAVFILINMEMIA